VHRRHALWFIPSLGLIACLVAGGCGQNLSQSSAPYNQGSNAGADRFGRDVRPGEGIARDGSVVGGSTLVLGIKVTGADLDDTDMDYAGNPAAFVEWAGKKGFGAIGLYAVEPTEEADQVATFYFPDVEFASGKRLSEYGYAPGPDYLTPLVRAARGAGIGTQADLTRLAMSLPESSLVDRPFAGEPLSANEIEYLCSYLLQTTELDSISARGFPPEWVAAAQKACEAAGRRFFAGDYDALQRAESGAAALLDLGPEGMAQNELALGVARRDPFMLWAGLTARRDQGRGPLADAWGSLKEVEAALLYRTVLSAPQGLYLDLPPSVFEDLDAGLIERLKRVAAQRRARPVCNVVVMGDSTPSNLTAIVNGITAAGYDIVMGPRPKSPAAINAYYIIVTPASDGSMPDPTSGLPEGVFNLGVPLVLQVCGVIPDVGVSQSWDAVRRSFGLTNLPFAALDKGPARVTYAGQEVPCAADSRGVWGPKVTAAHLSQAVVLAQGTASVDETVAAPETEETPSAESADAARAPRDRDVVTIAEFSYGAAGRNVLIAGRELQPEMAFPISNVLSSGLGLQAPTRVLVSVGSPVALYSPFGDGEVTVSFNDAGEVKTETRTVKKGTVEIIDVALQTAVRTMPLPDHVTGQ
jgi:hypothetical protein